MAYTLLDNVGIPTLEELNIKVANVTERLNALSSKSILQFDTTPTVADFSGNTIANGQIIYTKDNKCYYQCSVNEDTGLTPVYAEHDEEVIVSKYAYNDLMVLAYSNIPNKYYYEDNTEFEGDIEELIPITTQKTISIYIKEGDEIVEYIVPVWTVSNTSEEVYYFNSHYYYVYNNQMYNGSTLDLIYAEIQDTFNIEINWYYYLENVDNNTEKKYVYYDTDSAEYFYIDSRSICEDTSNLERDETQKKYNGYDVYEDADTAEVYYVPDSNSYFYVANHEPYTDITYTVTLEEYEMHFPGNPGEVLRVNDNNEIVWEAPAVIIEEDNNGVIISDTVANWDGSYNSDGDSHITKIGDVTSGTWNAGDVTAPNIEATTKIVSPAAEIEALQQDMLNIHSDIAGVYELTTGVVTISGNEIHVPELHGTTAALSGITASTATITGTFSAQHADILTGIMSGVTANTISANAISAGVSLTYQGYELSTLLSGYVPKTEKGVASGVATLDMNGRIPLNQLPTEAVNYKGDWNVATNTPDLSSLTPTRGDMYFVSEGGTSNLTGTLETYYVGDRVIYNGTSWNHIPNGAVYSVNNKTGAVVIDSKDINESSTNISQLIGVNSNNAYVNAATAADIAVGMVVYDSTSLKTVIGKITALDTVTLLDGTTAAITSVVSTATTSTTVEDKLQNLDYKLAEAGVANIVTSVNGNTGVVSVNSYNTPNSDTGIPKKLTISYSGTVTSVYVNTPQFNSDINSGKHVAVYSDDTMLNCIGELTTQGSATYVKKVNGELWHVDSSESAPITGTTINDKFQNIDIKAANNVSSVNGIDGPTVVLPSTQINNNITYSVTAADTNTYYFSSGDINTTAYSDTALTTPVGTVNTSSKVITLFDGTTTTYTTTTSIATTNIETRINKAMALAGNANSKAIKMQPISAADFSQITPDNDILYLIYAT